MLDNIALFFLKNRFFSVLLLSLVIVLGVIHSLFDKTLSWLPDDPLSVDAIPDVRENQQIVYTAWEGPHQKMLKIK